MVKGEHLGVGGSFHLFTETAAILAQILFYLHFMAAFFKVTLKTVAVLINFLEFFGAIFLVLAYLLLSLLYQGHAHDLFELVELRLSGCAVFTLLLGRLFIFDYLGLVF